jgi:hypothetical protein
VGDVIHILNLGGVAGICTSANVKEVGNALKVRVLGAVLSSKGKPLNIKDYKLFEPIDDLKMKVPIIVVSGTCMNVGKTSIACEIIKSATRKGLTVYSAKLAGIAALKDFSKIPLMNYKSRTEYRENNKIEAYDMLAQIYRSSDSSLKYTIKSGFLKGESKLMDRNSIPKVFSIYNQKQNGTLSITQISEGIDLKWQIDSSGFAQLISLRAIGPLCNEVLSDDYRELSIDMLTSSFYEEANPKVIPGVKVTE